MLICDEMTAMPMLRNAPHSDWVRRFSSYEVQRCCNAINRYVLVSGSSKYHLPARYSDSQSENLFQ